MDVGEGPSHIHHAPSTREEIIQVGHTVLLKIPSGDVRTIKVEANAYAASQAPMLVVVRLTSLVCSTINLNRFGSFPSSELLGQPFGLSYEIVGKTLKVLPPRPMQEVGTNSVLRALQLHDRTLLQRIRTQRTS